MPRLRFSESAYSRWDVLGIMVLLSFFPAAWLWADNGSLPSLPDRGLAVGVVLGLGAFILLLLLRLYHLHQLMARQALVLPGAALSSSAGTPSKTPKTKC